MITSTTGRFSMCALALLGCGRTYTIDCDDPARDSLCEEYGAVDVGPETKTYTVQLPTPQLDVLVVVDASGSMAEITDETLPEVALDLWAPLLASGVDVSVGVIAVADPDDPFGGRLREVDGRTMVSTRDPGGAHQLAELLDVGSSGTADELLAHTVWRALRPSTMDLPATNPDFRRREASLHIVALSDEADASWSLGSSATWPLQTPEDFVAFVEAQVVDPLLVGWSSVGGPVPAGCTRNGVSASASRHLAHYAEEVGATQDRGAPGVFASLCDDLDDTLRDIGDAMVTPLLEREVVLPESVDPATLEVQVTPPDLEPLRGVTHEDRFCGDVPCIQYDLDPRRNSLVFRSPLPAGSVVDVQYTPLPEQRPDFSFGDD